METAPIGQRFNRLVVHYETRSPRLMVCLCDCGNVAMVPLRSLLDEKNKSCGCFKMDRNRAWVGDRHPNWKGGRHLRQDGYAVIHSPSHPRSHKGYVLEHIPAAEDKLGRALLPGETVHHINGIKDDNHPDNLEVWDHNHGKGQKREDKIRFYADSIIAGATQQELKSVLAKVLEKLGDHPHGS